MNNLEFNFEYNDSVQGFVVTHTSGAEANLQYCNLNGEMVFGSDGGYRSDDWTDEMEEAAYEAAEKNEQVRHVQSLFIDIYSGDSDRLEKFEMIRADQSFLTILNLEWLANDE